MATWRDMARPLRRLRISQLSTQRTPSCARRWYSEQAAAAASAEPSPLDDLEPDSSLGAPGPTPEHLQEYTAPWKRARERKHELPASKYQYHPPKFDRGPLHPIQSPPSSDPIARDYQPGPFYFPRLKETWQSTIAPDLMTLAYQHKPPGEQKEERIGQRLRGWDGSSPYHKNRPLRGPRGGTTLRPVERDITFKNVPEILAVSMSTFQPQAIKEPTYLLAARSAIQAVMGAKPEIIRINKGVSQWGIAKGNLAGAKATVYGEQAYELLDKMIHLVFPRIKEWPGVNAGSGDDTGNIGWGFTREEFALFPEIQVNYDAYPPKMIPGAVVTVQTTAKSDRHARLLLQAMGVPFYGKFEY
ncbi:ribosomal protein L5 [Cryphonectria parasitica EP155]|uniref:Ribosomal protein L5 n=1 Tax=Cryphonectria parasitica (strain ATCC 38755 / EP155) TaxID=660469 RepID=A0A9P4YD08_CRYP1|nr:ribosomal protein L5 [Cryphonectria parasitica EP155]KAF3771247.1 ribosomal protein L5 [Cryphonectria parasitica EP155]